MADIIATLGIAVDTTGAVTATKAMVAEFQRLQGAAEKVVNTAAAVKEQWGVSTPVLAQMNSVLRQTEAAQRALGSSMNADIIKAFNQQVALGAAMYRDQETAARAAARAQRELGAAMNADIIKAFNQQVALGAAMYRDQETAARAAARAQRELGAAMNADIIKAFNQQVALGAAMYRDQETAARAAARAQRELGAAMNADITKAFNQQVALGAAMYRDQETAARAAARAQRELGAAMNADITKAFNQQVALGAAMYRDQETAARAAARAQRELGAAMNADIIKAHRDQVALGNAMYREQEAATRKAQKATDDYNKAHGQALEMEKRRNASLNSVVTATNNAAAASTNLTSILSKLGVAFTAGQIIRAGAEVLTMAARYETLGVVLDVVGRNVGKSREEMNGLAESLQKTGISMVASREELARMAAANLNLGQAASIARVAQDAAVIAGVNSSAAFERVITAITTQQPRVLRTIGIYVNFEAAQEAAAKKMGKRVEQLTAAERIQTNMNVAIAGGAQVTGAYIRAMDTAGKQLTSTVRYMQDMKTQLGETFLPEFTAGVKVYADTLKFVGDNAAIIAPMLGGLLVGGLILVTAAIWKMVAAVAVLKGLLTGGIGIAAMLLAVAATAAFAKTAGDARVATAKLNAQLDADSRVVTSYTEKIEKMSLALLKLERQKLNEQSRTDASRILVLEDRVKAAKAEADKKTLVGTDVGVVAVADPAAVLRLKEAYEALAKAMREAGITNEQLTKLTQITAKAETDALVTVGEEAGKAAKKLADFQKTLREANDALLLSAAVMDAGAAPTLAQQRALEDLNTELELAAKILDIKASATGKDAEYTKEQAAQLILVTQRTAENTAATVARTRAYEDWMTTLDEGSARWEKEREAAQKHAEIQTEETKRITDAMDARDKAVQGIEDELKAKREEIAIAQTRGAGQKKDLEYLTLRNAKNKEFMDATRVGQFGIPDPAKAKALTDEFIALQRVQDALKDKADSWKSALSDVTGIAKSLARAFGEVGDRISGAISSGVKLYQVFSRQVDAASKLTAALANQKANPSKAADAAVDAAKGASKGAAFATATSVVAVGLALAEAADLFGTRAAARAKEMREAARAFNDALDDFVQGTKKLDGYAGQFQQALKEVTGGLDSLLKLSGFEREQGVPASNYVNQATVNQYRAESQRLGQFKEDPVAFGQAIQYRTLADGLQKMVDALAERVKALTPKLVADINTYYNAAFGNDTQNQLDAAKTQWVQFTQDLVASLNVGGLTLEEYNTQITRLNDAYTENIRKINEEIEAKKRQEQQRIDRSVFDTTNATRAFTDPRGAGLAALDENAARRYNDAATAAEKLAVAAFNAAERIDYLAKQAEADRRTTEGFEGRVLATLGNDRATQDQSRGASQRQEMADAIASGMSETNKRMLEFVHFAENSYVQMQRAIEDGTKAIYALRDAQVQAIEDGIEKRTREHNTEIAQIDGQIKNQKTLQQQSKDGYNAQIDAIKDATKAQTKALDAQIKGQQSALKTAQAQLSMLEKVRGELLRLAEFSESLKLGALSPLSPGGKLTEARRQFDAAVAGGDPTALPDAATALLEASRDWNASSQGFVDDYNKVQDALALAMGGLPVDQQTLLAAQKQVETLQASIELMQEQKQSIEDAAAAEILILEVARDIADKGFADTIQNLEVMKEFLTTTFVAWIDEQRAQIKRINDAADTAVTNLIATEQAAHNDRVRIERNTLDTSSNTKDTVTELKATVVLLQTGFKAVREELVTTNELLTDQLRVQKRAYNETPA